MEKDDGDEMMEEEGTFLSQPLFSDVADDSEMGDNSMISLDSPILGSISDSEQGQGQGPEPPFASTSTSTSTSDGRRVGVVAARIRKLDVVTSSTIRKTQVISKVSDVVRELVENSVDSEAGSIQVHLANYGLDKIEVRDTGHGIAASQLSNAVSGGHTSKLVNTEHLSSQSFYGFRGEALSSICSVAAVSVSTKTSEDINATKYELDNKSFVISQAVVAGGNGTIVVASNLFEKFPVRRLWIKDKKKCVAELKEMETFLKSVAIANPQTHISLYHNSSLVWNKASVSSIDQALVTVLGHFISKNLQRCGPIDIDVLSEHDFQSQQQRTIEAFFLKKPIDMKTQSWTGRKMTFLFLNRKRVVIEECEKLIQRYTVAAIERPAPADARRFPVAVVNITLPAEEVDFNREMDKSKVFIVHKDLVLLKLEELLQTFYGITSLEKPTINKENEPESVEEVIPTNQPLQKDKDRQSTIKLFLENVPIVSDANFSQSPSKNTKQGALNNSNTKEVNEDCDRLEQVPFPKPKPLPFVSNFELNLDDILNDTPPDDIVEAVKVPESSSKNEKDTLVKTSDQNPTPEERIIDMNQLLRERIPDINSHGSELQNVNILNRPPLSTSPAVVNSLYTHNSTTNSTLNRSANAFDRIGSGLELETVHGREPKRPKLLTDNRPSSSHNQLGMSFSGTGRQVTLDHFENWDSPAPKRKSSSSEYRFDSPILKPSRFTPASSASHSNSVSASPFSTPIPRIRNSSFTSSANTRHQTPTISNLWNKNRTSSIMKQRVISSTDVNNGGYTMEVGNRGSLIGSITDESMYPAKINDFIGVFHPMNMLQEFPSLKFELNIELVQVSGGVGSSCQYKYIVAMDCASKLFSEFVTRVDPDCQNYPNIFHKLNHLSSIRGTWQSNFTKSHSSDVQEMTQEA